MVRTLVYFVNYRHKMLRLQPKRLRKWLKRVRGFAPPGGARILYFEKTPEADELRYSETSHRTGGYPLPNPFDHTEDKVDDALLRQYNAEKSTEPLSLYSAAMREEPEMGVVLPFSSDPNQPLHMT